MTIVVPGRGINQPSAYPALEAKAKVSPMVIPTVVLSETMYAALGTKDPLVHYAVLSDSDYTTWLADIAKKQAEDY